jgi:hypothetical protein
MTKSKVFTVCICALLLGFLLGYFVAAPLRGGLLAALRPLLENPAALVASGVALLIGIAGFIVNWRQGNVAKRSADAANTSAEAARKTAEYAGTRALANVRIVWLNSVRDILSEYHSILMTPKEEPPLADEEAKASVREKTAVDRRQLSFLGTKLDLLLNQEKKFQKELWQVTDDILKRTDSGPLSESDLEIADKQLVIVARKVIDFHWQKIQAEILGQPQLTEPQYELPALAPAPDRTDK